MMALKPGMPPLLGTALSFLLAWALCLPSPTASWSSCTREAHLQHSNQMEGA